MNYQMTPYQRMQLGRQHAGQVLFQNWIETRCYQHNKDSLEDNVFTPSAVLYDDFKDWRQNEWQGPSGALSFKDFVTMMMGAKFLPTRKTDKYTGRPMRGFWGIRLLSTEPRKIVLKPEENGIIYVVESTDKHIKIGWTRQNPESRLRQLQTGNSRSLRLVMSFPGNQRMERMLHEKCYRWRLNGEWFSKEALEIITTLLPINLSPEEQDMPF